MRKIPIYCDFPKDLPPDTFRKLIHLPEALQKVREYMCSAYYFKKLTDL